MLTSATWSSSWSCCPCPGPPTKDGLGRGPNPLRNGALPPGRNGGCTTTDSTVENLLSPCESVVIAHYRVYWWHVGLCLAYRAGVLWHSLLRSNLQLILQTYVWSFDILNGPCMSSVRQGSRAACPLTSTSYKKHTITRVAWCSAHDVMGSTRLELGYYLCFSQFIRRLHFLIMAYVHL